MIYDLSNEYDAAKFKERAKSLLHERAVVEMAKKTTKRSLAQNSYLHVLLGYFASEFGYTMEEVKHDIFKKRCNPELFLHKRKNKRGFEVTYVRSSTELDKSQMTQAIERFRNYSSAVCGLYLPEPNEHRALIFAQQQIEQYKQFV